MRAMYYIMAFLAAVMSGWCFADTDYVLAVIYAVSAVLWFIALRLTEKMGKIEIRATTDGSGSIKFVASVCEPSKGESSGRMKADMIWRLVKLWRDDMERYDAYCYDGKEIRKLDNEEPKREEV